MPENRSVGSSILPFGTKKEPRDERGSFDSRDSMGIFGFMFHTMICGARDLRSQAIRSNAYSRHRKGFKPHQETSS
jgi:hypothetical protein